MLLNPIRGALSAILDLARSKPEKTVPYEHFMAALESDPWCNSNDEETRERFLDIAEDYLHQTPDLTLSAAKGAIEAAVSDTLRNERAKGRYGSDMPPARPQDIRNTARIIAEGTFYLAADMPAEPAPGPEARGNIVYPDFTRR